MKHIAFALVLLFSLGVQAQNVGIGTNNPDASAAFEVKDSARGMLIPRLTMSKRMAITNPAEGLMVYQTDSSRGYWGFINNIWTYINVIAGTAIGQMQYWNGVNWVQVSPGGYGQSLIFCDGVPTWGGCIPKVTTSGISAVAFTTASGGGNVTADGGATVTARGVCWSTAPNPTVSLSTKTTNGTGVGTFTSSLTGLTPGTLYYVRAYATNSVGTAYGAQQSFTTNAQTTPTVTTTIPSSISFTTASSGGNVTSDGGASVSFRGVCWSTSPNPTVSLSTKTVDGTGTGNFTSNITGLTPNTTYYVRAYATNSVGTAYGAQQSFTTLFGSISTLNCASATNNGSLTVGVAANSVSSIVPYTGGNGGPYTAQSVSSSGVTGLIANLTAGNFASGVGTLTYTITGSPSASGTAIFVLSIGGQTCTLNRTVNDVGSSASCGATDVHNPVLNYGTMTDQDENVYKTIQIGTQTWMAENLKARRYRNGDVIPVITDNTIWSTLTTGATCWYNNDSVAYNCPYGRLYNWYAIVDSRNVCPTGWHMPTDAEFTTLTSFLGGENSAGGKMKTTGTQYWQSSNTAADNSTGFSGLPGGSRYPEGTTVNIGLTGHWWSSTENASVSGSAWYRALSATTGIATRSNYDIKSGFSVRCIKDNPAVVGSITTLNCSGAINDGALTQGSSASNVSSAIPYTGGNGGTYSAQSVNSTGVTGLTATLAAGNFAGGSGSLTYTITGTPSSSGTASFALSIGGQSCTLTRTVNLPAGTISSINCTSATNSGTLTAGIPASSASSSVPYTGGNGGTYSAQTVASTGVTGLTATLAAGTFASGTGNLTYTITGTPASSGTASFALNIGGQSCTLNFTVNVAASTASCGATDVHNSVLTYGSMTDQDGNVYKTIQIGSKTWMAENLKARRYRNGDVIPVVTDSVEWASLITGATCWYNNDSATYDCPYGKLYNWHAVADSRNVCPTGWHVPSDAEFTTLTNSLGVSTIAGGKMKTVGTQYWLTPNGAADNSSGWSGLPGGLRSSPNGKFINVGTSGVWWSSTPDNVGLGGLAWFRRLNNNDGEALRSSTSKPPGLSVRCLKD